jgi:hypothetical protein
MLVLFFLFILAYKGKGGVNQTIRKSILLRAFLFYKKYSILNVRLDLKLNYERALKHTHFCERF